MFEETKANGFEIIVTDTGSRTEQRSLRPGMRTKYWILPGLMISAQPGISVRSMRLITGYCLWTVMNM